MLVLLVFFFNTRISAAVSHQTSCVFFWDLVKGPWLKTLLAVVLACIFPSVLPLSIKNLIVSFYNYVSAWALWRKRKYFLLNPSFPPHHPPSHFGNAQHGFRNLSRRSGSGFSSTNICWSHCFHRLILPNGAAALNRASIHEERAAHLSLCCLLCLRCNKRQSCKKIMRLKPLDCPLLNKPTGQVDGMQPEEKPSKNVWKFSYS